MRRMSWKVWKLFRRKNRLCTRGHWQTRNTCQPEVLEPRALLTGTASGEISGVAFIDANNNTTKDTGELAVSGLTVTLTGNSTGGIAVNVSTTTRADGSYKIENVLAGTAYTLSTGAATGLSGSPVFSESNLAVAGDTTVTRNFAFTNGIKAEFLSIRQFLTETTLAEFPFSTAGTTNGKAAERENDLPTLTAGVSSNIYVNATGETVYDLAGAFSDADTTNSQVKIKTSSGDINVELFDTETPKTVANFFNYAIGDPSTPNDTSDDRYDDTFFHRLVTGFVLQGGGFSFEDGVTPSIDNVDTDSNLENEYVPGERSNTIGTIAMAKQGGNPDSATSQFFFNLADNSSNLDNQNGGFTVFGKVTPAITSLANNTVLNDLATSDITNQSLTNGALSSLPLNSVYDPDNDAGTTNNNDPNFLTTVEPADFVKITDVEVVRRDEFLTYSIVDNSNSDPTHVTASIENNRLIVNRTAGGDDTTSITIRATDKFGASFEQVFQIGINHPPSITSVTLAPPTPTPDDTVTATVIGLADVDAGQPLRVSYVWKVDGIIVKENLRTTLTTDTLNLSGPLRNVATNEPVLVTDGSQVRVEVTPRDTVQNGIPVNATVIVDDPV